MEDHDFIMPTWVKQNLEALSNVIGKDTCSKMQQRRTNRKDLELDLYQEDNKQEEFSADQEEVNDPYSSVSNNITDNSLEEKVILVDSLSKKTSSKTSADLKTDIIDLSPNKITKQLDGAKAETKDKKSKPRIPAAERQKRCRERKKNYDKQLEDENKVLKDQNISLVRELKECKQKVWIKLKITLSYVLQYPYFVEFGILFGKMLIFMSE